MLKKKNDIMAECNIKNARAPEVAYLAGTVAASSAGEESIAHRMAAGEQTRTYRNIKFMAGRSHRS